MEFSTEFKDWLNEKIADGLDQYEGTSVYGSELAYKLFEGENVDGSVTYSTYEAKEFIKEHWDDAGEISEYLKSELDMTINPFDEPEKFHVCMLLEGTKEILNQTSFANDHWNDEHELDQESIESIKNDLGIEANENKEQELLNAILVRPDAGAKAAFVKNELSAFQEFVGGNIEVVYPFDDEVGLICNEEGKNQRLPMNRALYDSEGNIYDIIAGDFLVIGLSEDDFASLSDDLFNKYMDKYITPETFVNMDGKFVALKGFTNELSASLDNEATDAQSAAKELSADNPNPSKDFKR